MGISTPAWFKVILYTSIIIIQNIFSSIGVISEKSAPEITSLDPWGEPWPKVGGGRPWGFCCFLVAETAQKTRFWAQGGRNLFPDLHIRSAESTNVLYDAWKDELLHTTSGTLPSVHRKIAGRSPDPCFRDTNVHYDRDDQCIPVVRIGPNQKINISRELERVEQIDGCFEMSN